LPAYSPFKKRSIKHLPAEEAAELVGVTKDTHGLKGNSSNEGLIPEFEEDLLNYKGSEGRTQSLQNQSEELLYQIFKQKPYI